MKWNWNGSNEYSQNKYVNEDSIKYIRCSKKKEFYKKLTNLKKLLHDFLCKTKNNSNKKKSSDEKKNIFTYIVLTVVILILSVWICSGIYTIRESDRGVVLRFGKFNHFVQPGLNWKPTFIDVVIPVNVESVRELATSGMMLTSDENVVHVEMNVQYLVTNPRDYLFNVTNADDSLRQATDSALRGVIGKYTMDRILTEGRTVVRNDTQKILEDTIRPYKMGITLIDVNFQTARPPEEVKAAFDDAIAARENEQQYIREAEAYSNEVLPRATGKAHRILEESRAYKTRTILEAQGEIQKFSNFLPEYKLAPEITRERLYIDAMEKILKNTKKIFIDDKIHNNLIVLSMDHIKQGSLVNEKKIYLNDDNMNLLQKYNAQPKKKLSNQQIIMNQRNDNNIKRNNILREGR